MKSQPRAGCVVVLALAAGVVAAGGLGRGRLSTWTRERLSRQYHRQLVALPEHRAVLLVRHLEHDGGHWLNVIVGAASDPRPAVAQAGQAALLDLIDHWGQLPAGESSPRVAALATLLARQAPRLSPEQLAFARSLAQRLLVWPVDGRQIDAARLIADCEAVLLLLLPLSDPLEIRLAAAPPTSTSDLPAESPLPAPTGDSPAPSPPPVPSIPPPTAAPPATVAPQMPAPLPDANRETPQQPKRFVTPKAIRISDDDPSQ